MKEREKSAQAKTGKRERLQSLLARDPGVLVCPVCGAALRLSRGDVALRCARGHCYDIAKKGYVNLLGRSGGAKGVYGAAFFESRREAFGFGLCEEAAQRIAALAREILRPAEAGGATERAGAIRVLDAGCGEGYYAFALSRDASLRSACRFYGLDLSRDAVAMATDYDADIAWIVGDLAKPPFRDGAFGLVLNVLSPANYGAFRRVLARDGILIKVMPGRDHLQELRALCGELEGGRGGEEAREHSERHMRVAARANVRYARALGAEQKRALPAMTPLTAGRTVDPGALDSLRRVTIDLEIVAGRPL
ncbi:MAG: methyltransferase domain-containing protein [Clostridiales Family XIII bacterium]|nr:methyltransferase domain-containing protein [Clostridiales Family XIII bacterium]